MGGKIVRNCGFLIGFSIFFASFGRDRNELKWEQKPVMASSHLSDSLLRVFERLWGEDKVLENG